MLWPLQVASDQEAARLASSNSSRASPRRCFARALNRHQNPRCFLSLSGAASREQRGQFIVKILTIFCPGVTLRNTLRPALSP